MPIDREETLKKAEKLARQGKLDAAVAECLRVVADQPGDWATANTLGDLYVRAGQPDLAAGQYARIAEHFMAEGFYSKASAIYKKLLKLTPDDEGAQLNLAELSQKQGLLADAKAQLNGVEARRRGRGDRAGAAEIVVRRGALDPGDFEARTAGARTLAEMGRTGEAAAWFRSIHDDLLEKDRTSEALGALRQSVELNPDDQEARVTLAKTAVQVGDFESARRFLDRETAGTDPGLLMALVEMECKAGRLDAARELLPGLLEGGRDQRQRVVDLAWGLAGSDPGAAFVLVAAAADAAVAQSEFADAAAVLKEFVTRVPRQIPALLKLVDVCVDAGLEAEMYETQAELADAYLATGQPAEARLIAEDLVAREPWEQAHIERFRRALIMLKVYRPGFVDRGPAQWPRTVHRDGPLCATRRNRSSAGVWRGSCASPVGHRHRAHPHCARTACHRPGRACSGAGRSRLLRRHLWATGAHGGARVEARWCRRAHGARADLPGNAHAGRGAGAVEGRLRSDPLQVRSRVAPRPVTSAARRDGRGDRVVRARRRGSGAERR